MAKTVHNMVDQEAKCVTVVPFQILHPLTHFPQLSHTSKGSTTFQIVPTARKQVLELKHMGHNRGFNRKVLCDLSQLPVISPSKKLR